MTNFTYKAQNSSGAEVSGEVSAVSREAAIKNLRQQNYKPISVKEAGGGKKKFSLGGKRVKLRDLVIFTRELSTMISAGVPLPRGLATLAAQAENPYFKQVITNINHDIESGTQLGEALSKYPRVFSEVYVNMVKAGEAGGILDDILKRLATQVEKDATIHKKIRSAMAYPVVILCVTVVAFFGIMLVILPKIGKIITDLGGANAKLPPYTQVMLNFSNFCVSSSILHPIPNAVFLIGVMIGSSIYLRRYIRTPAGAYKFHSLMLRVPVIKMVIIKITVARFARTFSSLMGAGVSVLESLEVTGNAVGNKVFQKEIKDIAESVKNGQSLGKLMTEAQFFPPIVGQMIVVGEETGKIDQILVKVADFYEEEVDAVIDGLASIIEPIMIVVLGGLVGLIAASVMGPIANLTKNAGG
jgi:type IV pilus assembly protein PilC